MLKNIIVTKENLNYKSQYVLLEDVLELFNEIEDRIYKASVIIEDLYSDTYKED